MWLIMRGIGLNCPLFQVGLGSQYINISLLFPICSLCSQYTCHQAVILAEIPRRDERSKKRSVPSSDETEQATHVLATWQNKGTCEYADTLVYIHVLHLVYKNPVFSLSAACWEETGPFEPFERVWNLQSSRSHKS